MPDPGTQLRAYLDQTVERVDVEDVMARARVRRPRRPDPFVYWRPAWIAGAAASIMLISIGAVAAGAWLLRGEPAGDFATRTPPTMPASTGWSSVLVLGLAIGGSAIALLAGGTALSNLIHRMRDRRHTMQTIESPERELARLREENTRLNSTKRSLIAVLVVVLIAAAGAAAWLVIDNAGSATEREITAFVEDYYAAWRDADGAAVLSMMTDDATLYGRDGSVLSDESLATWVNEHPAWNPEVSGDIIIIEVPSTPTSPAWLVASPTLAPDYPGRGDFREFELFSIVRQDGNLLIKYHETWFGEQRR